MTEQNRTFGQDLEFLKRHCEPIELAISERQKAIVVPAWQGRTMTSTAAGNDSISYGWLNYKRIESEKRTPQINLFGGEDRLWVGPEGSQFSIFFDPGQPMDIENWRTPAPLDTEPFQLVANTENRAEFRQQFSLTNYQDFQFDLQVERDVMVLDDDQTQQHLGLPIPKSVDFVCHESKNRVQNTGATDWMSATGLISLWMLGMNRPSPTATVMVPFRHVPKPVNQGAPDSQKILTSDYFGHLDQQRLKVDERNNLIFFKGDGHWRSKIGVAFNRAENFMGAWDSTNGCLTIVQFNLPESVDFGYTNNLWKEVPDPFHGDVINSYNDGPDERGTLMGGFYELETLSPALALGTGESYQHIHRTFHLQGDRTSLDSISQQVFDVSLDSIESVFPIK